MGRKSRQADEAEAPEAGFDAAWPGGGVGWATFEHRSLALRPLGQVGMARVDRGAKGGEGPARSGNVPTVASAVQQALAPPTAPCVARPTAAAKAINLSSEP
jgi:hypothetical protein